MIVLAPSSVQEAVDLMILAFELAEKYRNPVMIVADGMIGQMMEPVEFPGEGVGAPMQENDWALTGCEGRERRIVNSLYLSPEELNEHNLKLKRKFDEITKNEMRSELYGEPGEYDLLIIAFGTMARICKTAIDEVRRGGPEGRALPPDHAQPVPLRGAARGDGRAARGRQGASTSR